MRVLLLHLSDMHATANDTVLLGRAPAIAPAVQDLALPVDLAVILVSGDVANRGLETDYLAAMQFLDALTASFSERLRGPHNMAVPVRRVLIPGNHDCDFSRATGARAIVLDSLLKDVQQLKDSSVVELCTSVQDSFFEFLATAASEGRSPGTTGFHERLHYEYRFGLNDRSIRFVCLNTAWLTRKEEEQGSLFFPAEAVPQSSGDDLTVVTFHHPQNWLEATSARAFRKKVEILADVILTGHEHDSTHRLQIASSGERNILIEGGALHDHDHPSASVFNALVFDTTALKRKAMQYVWNGERYIPSSTGQFSPEWEPYKLSPLHVPSRYELTEKAVRQLDDSGMTLTHRRRGVVSLSDIFVYPDVREVKYPPEHGVRIVRGDNVFQMVKDSPYLLITGDSEAGKTSLAKMLYKQLHAEGYVPVLVPAAARLKTDERALPQVERLFAGQYDNGNLLLPSFQQLERSRRVIIFDDYHKLPIRGQRKQQLLRTLGAYAGKLILMANGLLLSVDPLGHPMLSPDPALPFEHYRILPFGHVRRDALIDKWLFLGTEGDTGASDLAHQVAAIHQTLDTLLGKNYVPAYPSYILSVLQASDAMTPIDTGASTHGYFYELLIRTSLARGRSRVEYDILSAYTAHLAFHLFLSRTSKIDHATFQEIHEQYERRYDIRRSSEQMLATLLGGRVLQQIDSSLRFRYGFLYYYFVASYMRDHIADQDIRARVTEMTRTLYVEEFANILLFLSHLTKDPLILGEMVKAAGAHFSSCVPARMEEDVEFLNCLEPAPAALLFQEEDVEAARARMLEAMDRVEETEGTEEDEVELWDGTATRGWGSEENPVVQLNGALKTLQILGQLLKNFPGSMQAGEKLRITVACYELGLRVLSWLLGLVRENQLEIAREMAKAFRIHHAGLSNEEVARRAQDTVVGLSKFVGFGVVRRISNAVGSPELHGTYEKVLASLNSLAARLVHTSLLLDLKGDFPVEWVRRMADEVEKNPYALSILQYLAISHFLMFPVDYRTKQKVCARLRMSYMPLEGLASAHKLIAGKR